MTTVLLVAWLCSLAPLASAAGTQAPKKPNIVFFLVDDHDPRLNSTAYMPKLNKQIIDKGVTFENWFVNTPVCCPSRATVLTGRFAHNTNFTDLFPPYGGHTVFMRQGLDKEYLPTWMADQGYGTYFVGKYVIEYALYNYKTPPRGWTDFDAVLFPYTFNYTHPVFSRNGGPPVSYPNTYSTDLVRDKALAQIRSAHAAGRPFFVEVAPASPHDTVTAPPFDATRPIGLLDLALARALPPMWAKRHDGMFEDEELPFELVGSFNETDIRDKAWWNRDFRALTNGDVTKLREAHRARLRALQAVDDMVGAVVSLLEELGELDNTYIFYTSDNGYHLGAHRQGAGKESPYEEDVRVPFYVRGPGLKEGASSAALGSHVDLAATFVSLAGGAPPALSDGQPVPLQPVAKPGFSFFVPKHAYEFTPVEFWGWYANQVAPVLSGRAIFNFVYKTIRADARATRGAKKYSSWCNGEKELYDLAQDPFELDNVFRASPEFATLAGGKAAGEAARKLGVRLEALGRNGSKVDAPFLKRVADRLDALISGWYNCKGQECVTPLARHLPGVTSLEAAMDPSRDAFFANLPRFKWDECMMHLEAENEHGAFDQPPVKTKRPKRRLQAAAQTPAAPAAAVGSTPGAAAAAEHPLWSARAAAAATHRAPAEDAGVPWTPEQLAPWRGAGEWVAAHRRLLTAFA